MGELMNYECKDSGCDWQTTAFIGAGMRSMGQLLYLCRRCHHLTQSDGGPHPWLDDPDTEVVRRKGKCSRCRRVAEPWPPGGDESRRRNLTCPICLKKTVKGQMLGIWD